MSKSSSSVESMSAGLEPALGQNSEGDYDCERTVDDAIAGTSI